MSISIQSINQVVEENETIEYNLKLLDRVLSILSLDALDKMGITDIELLGDSKFVIVTKGLERTIFYLEGNQISGFNIRMYLNEGYINSNTIKEGKLEIKKEDLILDSKRLFFGELGVIVDNYSNYEINYCLI